MVPKLRFENYFDNWFSNKLSDLAVDNKLSNGVFNDPLNVGSGYKLINVVNMYKEPCIDENDLSLLNLDEKTFRKNQVFFGDLFFTRSSLVKEGIAWSNIYLGHSEDVTFDGHLIKLTPDLKKTNPKFLYFCLKTSSVRKQLIESGKTATMTTIGQSDVGKTLAFIPQLKEQTKIADFLSSVDERIILLNKQYGLLCHYKKGMIQKIFSQELRFKDENGDVYSTWKINPLKELYTLLNTNSLSRSELNYESGNIKNIHYGDIHTKFSGRFDITKELVPYISKTIKIAEECYCRKGDLVIADASEDYNDIGKCIEITNVDQQQVVAGLHTFLARPNTTMALGFGSYMMQSSEVRRQIKVFATGVSVLSITKKNLLELMIPLPNIQEQTKIANFLSALDDKIAVKKAELDKLKTWKQGLLQQMFV